MGRHDGVPDVLLDARTRRGGAGLWEIHGRADAASPPGHPADRCPHHAGIGGARRQLHNAWLLFLTGRYVLITAPLGYAVEPVKRSAFRSLKIRIPRPIATGLTKMLNSSIRPCSINVLTNVAPPYTTMSWPR